jgi:hypothetical protein
MADSILTLNAMAGAKGQKTLTSSDSPYSYAGLIIGGVTSTASILLDAKQYNQSQNPELEAFNDREFSSSGTLDVTWSINNVITIPSGSITIYFG